jgi:predicted Zn finger-like uncharacterized protein
MNVACPACPAKYAVPDEKVRGKKARITCKRCGAAIIIDGTTLNQPSKPPPKPKLEPLPPPPEAMSAPEAAEEPLADGWLVAITDERQEPASTDRVVALYASGTIDAETFLWREGMAEWQTAFEIPEIAAALEARGLSHRVIEPGVESVPSRIPTYDDDEATHIGRPNTLGAQTATAASGWTEPGRWGGSRENESQAYDDDLTISRDSSPVRDSSPLGSAYQADDSQDARTIAREPSSPFGAPLPAAGRGPDSTRGSTRSSIPGAEVSPSSRRRHVRPAQRDSDHEAPAAAGRRATASPVSERGGQRVRNADLFGGQAGAGSEDDPALGRADSNPPEAAGAKLTGQRNESSVLFSLDALIKQEAAPEQARAPRPDLKSQRDTELLLGSAGPSSIANLGGDFNALIAPDLMAPARAMPEPFPSRASYDNDFAPPPSRGGRWLKALVLVILAGGIGAAIAVFAPKLLNPPKAPLVTASIPTEKSPEPKLSVTTTPPSETPAPSASAAAPPTGVGAKPDAPTASPGTTREPREPREPPRAATSKPEAPEKEKTLADAMGESTAAPFDQGAAKSALVTAANGAASCKKEGGPTGTGRALVTFAPSGRVTKAEITGDFAGTGVGGCVARLFRAARVPKFSGEPTTVSKNFTID